MIFTQLVTVHTISICLNSTKNCKCRWTFHQPQSLFYICTYKYISVFSTVIKRNFQNFENTQTSVPPNYDLNYPNTNNAGISSFYDPNAYAPNPYEQNDKGFKATGSTTGTEFEDEPPLLEELGINPNHIFQKVNRQIFPRMSSNSFYIFYYRP